MLIRMFALTLVAALLVTLILACGFTAREAVKATPVARAVAPKSQGLYRGHPARYYARLLNEAGAKIRRERALSRRRWRPTVEYAIRLASAVTGVPRWQLRSVGRCESHLYTFAENGRYKGVMQLGWSPFGLSPFDPVANVLSAALTVKKDGGWKQWQCRP